MPSLQRLSKPNTLRRPVSSLRSASPLSAEHYENKLRAAYTAAITDNQDAKFTSDVLLGKDTSDASISENSDTKFTSNVLLGIDTSNPSLPPLPKIKIPLSEAKIEIKRKRQERKNAVLNLKKSKSD